jgi:hypothetical protein
MILIFYTMGVVGDGLSTAAHGRKTLIQGKRASFVCMKKEKDKLVL